MELQLVLERTLSGYLAYVREYPDCKYESDTPESAIAGAEEALANYMEMDTDWI